MTAITKYNPDDVPVHFGLNNTGVICWFNSLMQALMSCSAVNRFLIDNKSVFANNQFISEYIATLEIVLDESNKSSVNFAARSAYLFGAFLDMARGQSRLQQFASNQQCGHEAFTMFMDVIGNGISSLFETTYQYFIVCESCRKISSKTHDKSLIIHLFDPSFKPTTAEEFAKYVRHHPSEHDEFECVCGHKMNDFKRIEVLYNVSSVLVFALNKFHEKKMVWFPKEFTIPGRGCELRYRLVAQIQHSGGMHGGHYWATSLRRGKTMTTNDTSVYPEQLDPRPESYLLFYHIV